jgi:secondary thiamine-phosphate synthase enzyme
MTKGARFKISTKGFNEVLDITNLIEKEIEKSGAKEGICLVFVAHSTCALTTIEYEEGAIEDLKRVLEKIAPMNENYEHCKKWGDCNGYAHVRAALMRPCLTLPVEKGNLVLGQWQQVVLIDFDNRPRQREIIVKIIKE